MVRLLNLNQFNPSCRDTDFSIAAHESFNGPQQRIEEPIAAKRTYEPQQVAPPVPADRRHLEDLTNQSPVNNSNYIQSINNNVPKENKAIIIAADNTFDPVSFHLHHPRHQFNQFISLQNSLDEMERRKEKIMLLSLQRRQQAEEAKARKEIESMQRREREREKEEERARRREEQAARRATILEQHKLKKMIEEAEREGKALDKSELMLQQKLLQQQHSHQGGSGGPKMRQQRMVRPRPKTIHVESGSVDLSDASSMTSRGKRGSNSNLTGEYHVLFCKLFKES